MAIFANLLSYKFKNKNPEIVKISLILGKTKSPTSDIKTFYLSYQYGPFCSSA